MDKKKYQRLKTARRARPVSERDCAYGILCPQTLKVGALITFWQEICLLSIGKFNELSTTFDMLEMPISRTLR